MLQKLLRNGCVLTLVYFCLAGCSLLSPVPADPNTSYVINSVPRVGTKKPTAEINLLVTQPTTTSIYDTTMMAYTAHPYQIAYFINSRWAETPTQMLQPLMIQTLQSTHYFHTVGSASAIGRYNFLLNTQLIQLQQDFSHTPSVLHLKLRAQLINASTNEIVASKEFSITEIIPQVSPYGGVTAANNATARMLKQLAQFCLKAF